MPELNDISIRRLRNGDIESPCAIQSSADAQCACCSIRLPDETVDYLQALDYEIGGLQVLHTHALNAGAPEDKVEDIRRRFQEKFQEYQLAKQELFAAFGQDHRDCKRWWVDFQEGVMHFEG